MDATYTLTQARASLGDVINEVRHGHKTVQLTDHGKPVAAIVPIELLDYLRQLEDERDLAEAEAILAREDRIQVPHDEVMARFGLAPNGKPL